MLDLMLLIENLKGWSMKKLDKKYTEAEMRMFARQQINRYIQEELDNKPVEIKTPPPPPKIERKYLPTFSELIDRLSIVQLKEVFIPEHRKEYEKEIRDIQHDIDLLLRPPHYDENGNIDSHALNAANIDGAFIRDIIVLAQMNLHIWHNESNFRKGIKDGNNLELTHGLNGIRNIAKNRIQELLGGRKDYKVDNVEAFKEWVPSWKK